LPYKISKGVEFLRKSIGKKFIKVTTYRTKKKSKTFETKLNHSRSHLMKVIALPTLDFSKSSHREFSSTQTSLTSVFTNKSLPLYL